ncbi:hypothetical protein C1J05_14905 [Sulfitobacter sp. JL08]|uniref:tyrosine-type recombinase/integrase n=1 Tax=Sulfitobacter sp. JL08 TaxID=2070369 RepID=UPI000E0C783B|nr:tyrosine-type recombinase/integrase [Sulfitobacter sp. JL08]AXI55619.1 hypothetical protein C1J05_14905 [Sulfitobacter sp. JL08]
MYTGSIPVLASKLHSAAKPLEDKQRINETKPDTQVSTDFGGTTVRVDLALEAYREDHLTGLRTGSERYTQLARIVAPFSHRQMHEIDNVTLSNVLGRWKGGTRNRYRAAVTHFWKWGRAYGYTTLHPTLLAGKETSRDDVLSVRLLRTLYHHAGRMDEPWATYGRLLILTGQRHGDVMNFHHERLHQGDMHLPTSKTGTPHIVTLGTRGLTLATFHCHGFNMATTAHFKRRWFRKAGVPLSYRLHDIRRSFATHLAEAGEDEADIDRMLNH